MAETSKNQINAQNRRLVLSRSIFWVPAAFVIAVCVVRYLQAPSFWLDEALVALSLRNPELGTIFGRLERGLYFPRLYLASIAALREIFGYRIWVLRLLPALVFVLGTLFWARLLAKRAGALLAPGLLGAALFIGSTFWLEQAIQLRHYSFEVMLAMVPFLLSDQFFKETLIEGKHKIGALAMALPCFLSYTYLLPFGARLSGWYVHHGRHTGWRLHWLRAGGVIVTATIGTASILAIDYAHGANLTDYWKSCILSWQLKQGFLSGLRLLVDFLWGWHHGRLMPLVLIAVAPLQGLAVCSILMRLKNAGVGTEDGRWGSRSIGSLVLLAGVVAASLLAGYPICAGRLTLFTQVHTQLLAIEGSLYILSFWNRSRIARAFLYVCIAIVMIYSGHRYIEFIRDEPPENLRPMLLLIKPEVANTVWVHPCSVAQVESLPEHLAVDEVLLRTRNRLPPKGRKVWILWTHLSEGYCREQLDGVRSEALKWQVIHEGRNGGLALAEF
jgi:hypothetical protein